MNEPTHISHSILSILDEWKLSSNVLILSEDTRDERITLIEDVFKIKRALLQYRYDKVVTETPEKLFDELYDSSVKDLEVVLCECFAELKFWILKTGRLPK